jgi:hypothetical protein
VELGTKIVNSTKYARVLLFHIEKMSCGAASIWIISETCS